MYSEQNCKDVFSFLWDIFHDRDNYTCLFINVRRVINSAVKTRALMLQKNIVLLKHYLWQVLASQSEFCQGLSMKCIYIGIFLLGQWNLMNAWTGAGRRWSSQVLSNVRPVVFPSTGDKREKPQKVSQEHKVQYKEESNSQGLSLKQVKFLLLARSTQFVTPHFQPKLAELQFLRMKGKEKPKPNSVRVCLSAIVDIYICSTSMAETQWEIRTSQPKLTVRSQTVKRSGPPTHAPCYNTQMDCHIRFRCIGYYTLGLLFPTHTWRDWVWGLSLLVPNPRLSNSLISLDNNRGKRRQLLQMWYNNVWKTWPVD